MTPSSSDKLLTALCKFLEQDAASTKSLANSAIDIARSNKEMNGILQAHLMNMEKTMDANQKVNLEALERMDKRYVPIERFTPVERLIYGGAGLILIAFMGALTFIVWGK